MLNCPTSRVRIFPRGTSRESRDYQICEKPRRYVGVLAIDHVPCESRNLNSTGVPPSRHHVVVPKGDSWRRWFFIASAFRVAIWDVKIRARARARDLLISGERHKSGTSRSPVCWRLSYAVPRKVAIARVIRCVTPLHAFSDSVGALNA